MKAQFILSVILLNLPSTYTLAGYMYVREQINTEGNNVGIGSNEKCYLVRSLQNNARRVVCKEGSHEKRFTNIGEIIGSATGTPGKLAYSNYIGFRLLDEGKSGMVGSAGRMIICDGPCKPKE